MADLTSASTGAGGLGTPAARWALTVTWALGLVSDVLSGAVAPPFGTELLALPFGLVAAVVLTTRGDDALPAVRAAAVATATVVSAIGALTSGAPLGATWSFNFAAYTAALLLPRGNLRSGIAGGALIGLLGTVWAVRFGASPTQFLDLLALPLLALAVGGTWRGLLGRIVRRELAYHREVERAAVAAEIADASAAATQTELADIGGEVGGLLSAISAGSELDDELVTEIVLAEADLRDRLRSPDLRAPLLRAAIDRARRRGVQVLLLGNPAQEAAVTGALPENLAAAVDAVDSGTVTLRTIPPGRTGAVSVLHADDETQERLLFEADGRLLSRR